ncbi:MAG: hypothetical protein IT328_11655 [Caldilineaceae bacterium]|nr:hypothetical protein [Caldilineaceae bacterium]
MHKDFPRPELSFIRAGAASIWRTLYAHRHPNATVHRILEVGEVVQLFNFSRQAGSLWAQVDTLQFSGNQRLYQKGFLRVPPTNPNSVLAFIPDYRYYTDVIPGGLPSHLAVGDTVALVEAYPAPGAPVYQAIPDSENAPATAGLLEPKDVARITQGPYRTSDNLLYWKIDNLNGSEDGYIQEYTRLDRRYRFFMRPHILANP